MDFEWDAEKEKANIKKHGVTFTDAEDVFEDPLRLQRRDDDSSGSEERRQTIGFSGAVLFVVYTERGDATRIISARLAEPFERRLYYGARQAYTHGWFRAYP